MAYKNQAQHISNMLGSYAMGKLLKRPSSSKIKPKNKRAKHQSYTKTVTKKRRRRPVGRASGIGGRTSLCSYVSPMSRYTRTALAGCITATIQLDRADIYVSSIGRQAAYVWADFGTRANFTNVAADYGSRFSGVSNPTNVYHITTDINESSWNNPGTMPLDIVFYSLHCRKDGNYDPVQAWNDGQTDMGDSSFGATNYRSTPHRAKTFTAHWKIASMTRVTLQPGEVHRRVCKWMKPRGVDFEFFESNPGSFNYYMANYSMVQMVVIHGYPAPLNIGTPTGPAASSTVATISPASVCVGVRKTLGYKFSTPVNKSFSSTNSLQLTGTVTNETELTLKQETPE